LQQPEKAWPDDKFIELQTQDEEEHVEVSEVAALAPARSSITTLV
jgi:hypothetical protein